MKFAVSYSFGKDSALALHRMKNDGHEPVCLITTVNEDAGRSWFHGVDDRLMDAVSDSLGIPLIKCVCTGRNYNTEFEESLMLARVIGAEACVFGDIDIEDHLAWNRQRCAASGLECAAPLWQSSRELIVHEIIECGIKAVVKCVRSEYLDDSFLGLTLTRKVARRIRSTKADPCGENGEYHTFVYNSPDFAYPIDIEFGDIIDLGTHSVLDIKVKD